MFKYRIHWADGSDAGEAEYAVNIKPGEIVWLRDGRKVRVLDLVTIAKDEGSRYVGLLRVEAA